MGDDDWTEGLRAAARRLDSLQGREARPPVECRPGTMGGLPALLLPMIRAAVSGRTRAGLVGGGALPYDGLATVRIGDCLVRLWIDAGSLDCVQEAVGPDGRKWGYDVVGAVLEGLAEEESARVEAWLKRLEPWH